MSTFQRFFVRLIQACLSIFFMAVIFSQQLHAQGKYQVASQRELTAADLQGKSGAELKIMRNEIFARYGYIFKTKDMKEYFAGQSWYRPTAADVTGKLTAIEKKNVELIKLYESEPTTTVRSNQSSSLASKTDGDGHDTWLRTFGGKGGTVKGESITSTSDGGILIAGTFLCHNGDFKGMEKGGTDVFVIKLDRYGKPVWKKNYGGSDNEDQPFMILTSDDGIVITGETSSHDGDFKGGKQVDGYDPDIFIMKLDKDGELLWAKTLGGTHRESRPIISTTSNGDILITGTTQSEDGDFEGINKGGRDVFVMKLDKDGVIIWKKTLGGSESESVAWINTTSDGSVLITGVFSSNDGDFKGMKTEINDDDQVEQTEDNFIAKLDKDGNLVWIKTVGRKVEDGGWTITSMSQTPDDRVVIAGYTQSNDGDDFIGNDEVDLYVLKLDKNGDMLWNEVYGGSDHEYGMDIRVTSDEGMLIVGGVSKPVVLVEEGTGNSQESSESDIILFKLDKDGDKLWERTFGGKGNLESGVSVTTTSDGNIVITGITDSNDGDFKGMNKGHIDAFIMQLDSNGNLLAKGKKSKKK